MHAVPRFPGLPLIGNATFMLDVLGNLEHAVRHYGDFVRLEVGGERTFIVAHPDEIEQVLVTHNRSFSKDRFLRDLCRVVGNGLLTSEGDFWRRQRRLAQPAFHRDRIAGYATTMVQCTAHMLERFEHGSRRNLHADMMALTLDIVSRTLFQSDVGEHVGPEVSTCLEEIMERYASTVQAFLPWLDRLPLPSNRRFVHAVERLDRLVRELITARRSDGRDGADLLSMLLSARDDDGSGMSDDQLRDEVLTIFLAGHETTALALTYAFYLLASHPDVASWLEQELDHTLEGRLPTIADMPRLRRAEHVILESMRLYPPAWSIGREATAPVRIGPLSLEPGNGVWISQWVVHRDPRFFHAPTEFRPSRWERDLQRRLPRFAYLPFGGGPRVCIGNGFAMTEATLLLATIASRFRFSLEAGFTMKLGPSITLRPLNGLPVVLEARRSVSSLT